MALKYKIFVAATALEFYVDTHVYVVTKDIGTNISKKKDVCQIRNTQVVIDEKE